MHAHYSQFITDKFLYDQPEAMHLLIQCGLKEQLFELAKTHRKLDEVLELLTRHGSLEIDPSIQSSLANRQFAEVLSNTANGKCIILLCMWQAWRERGVDLSKS